MQLHQKLVRQGLLGGMLLLAGCGLPPAVVVASYALDGVSYVATGKSVTDHAISAVSGQDCALHRIVTAAGEVCNEAEDIFLADAVLDNDAVFASLGPGPEDDATVFDTPAPTDLAFGGVPVRDMPGEQFLVLGSFADPANADGLATRLADMDAATTVAQVDGRRMHRVVVAADEHAAVAAAGFADAWPVELCPDSLTAAPCAAAPAITQLAAVPD